MFILVNQNLEVELKEQVETFLSFYFYKKNNYNILLFKQSNKMRQTQTQSPSPHLQQQQKRQQSSLCDDFWKWEFWVALFSLVIPVVAFFEFDKAKIFLGYDNDFYIRNAIAKSRFDEGGLLEYHVPRLQFESTISKFIDAPLVTRYLVITGARGTGKSSAVAAVAKREKHQ